MTITYLDIQARLEAMALEAAALRRRNDEEHESLIELCAGLGHRFGELQMTGSCSFVDKCDKEGLQHECMVCGFREWVGEVKVTPHERVRGVVTFASTERNG